MEILLIDRSQQHRHGPLDEFVLNVGNPIGR